MAHLELDDVTLAYDVTGDGEPIVLICGLGQPALSWHLGVSPALVEAGYQVITFDNRGVAPSSAPPAPYSINDMAGDTVALFDHLGIDRASVAGYSMGGWVAETLVADHPRRIRSAAFIGSCNESTSWEKASTEAELELARTDVELPPIVAAVDTLHYLPNHDLQDDDVVDLWLSLLDGAELWTNPGRQGQLEAALDWSCDPKRTARWPDFEVPCLVLSFEHDIDSPPARARSAAEVIGAEFVEVAGASHLGPLTHAEEVGRKLADFFDRT